MGPNVKFVSTIIDAYSNKKMGVNFFHQTETKPGGGLKKDQTFSGFFFSATFPKLVLIANTFCKVELAQTISKFEIFIERSANEAANCTITQEDIEYVIIHATKTSLFDGLNLVVSSKYFHPQCISCWAQCCNWHFIL